MPTELQDTKRADMAYTEQQLAKWRLERNHLSERWIRGADFLDELVKTQGQDCPEYTRYFNQLEKIDGQYKQACDRVAIYENQMKMLRDGVPLITKSQ